MVICPEACWHKNKKQKNERLAIMLNEKGRKANDFICDITIKTPIIR